MGIKYEQELASLKMSYREAVRRREMNTPLYEAWASAILSNIDLFKKTLEIATYNYLHEIENRFFRSAGRARAELFKQKLTEAYTAELLMTALKTVIREGNEYADSFKTFLFKGINLQFPQGRKLELTRWDTYEDILIELMAEMKRQLSCNSDKHPVSGQPKLT